MKTFKTITACFFLLVLPAFVFAGHFSDGNKQYLQGAYDKALDEYNQVIKDKPDFYEGYYNAGNALYRQEQYEQALQMYNKALQLNPKDEDTQANIEVTQEKLKKQSQNSNPKSQGNQKQNQQGQGQQSQNSNPKSQGNQQQGQKGQKADQRPTSNGQQSQPPEGMSADEVQALMNMMQKQEKQYKNYFGRQNTRPRSNSQMPDLFNMSPEEIQQYMMQRMMDPGNFQQQAPSGNSKEKDW